MNIVRCDSPDASLQLKAGFGGWESDWAFANATLTILLNHSPLGIIWMWFRTCLISFWGMRISKTGSLISVLKDLWRSCESLQIGSFADIGFSGQEIRPLHENWCHGLCRSKERFPSVSYKPQLLAQAGHHNLQCMLRSGPAVCLGFGHRSTFWNTEKIVFRVSPALKTPSSRLPGQIYPFGFQWSRADDGDRMEGWASAAHCAQDRLHLRWAICEASSLELWQRGIIKDWLLL